jgi:hypothetical protein
VPLNRKTAPFHPFSTTISMSKFLILVLVITSLQNCHKKQAPNCNCNVQLPKAGSKSDTFRNTVRLVSTEMDISFFSDSLKKVGFTRNIGYNTQNIYNQLYVSFITGRRGIIFFNLKTNQITATPLPDSLANVMKQYWTSIELWFQDSIIHFFNNRTLEYWRLGIAENLTLHILDYCNIRKLVTNPKKAHFNLNYSGRCFSVQYPFFYLLYLDHSKRTFIDDTVFFKINIPEKKLAAIVESPAHLRSCYLRQMTVYCIADKANNLYTLYAKSNILSKYDANGKLLQQVNLPDTGNYMNYDHTFEQDWAYDRKYMENDGLNISLLSLANNHFAVLKRLRKEKLIEAPMYVYYIYDESMGVTGRGSIPPECDITTLRQTTNGFTIAVPQKQKIYVYELAQ